MLQEVESEKKSFNSKSSKSSQGQTMNIYKMNSQKFRSQLLFVSSKKLNTQPSI